MRVFVSKFYRKIAATFLAVLAGVLSIPVDSVSATSVKYPRLADYYLRAPIAASDVSSLARYDLLILGMQAQSNSPDQIRAIRKLNPNIKILAYVASQEVPYGRIDEVESKDGLWHQLVGGISDSWWLRDSRGGYVSTWPGNRSLNVTNYAPIQNGFRWNTYLPNFMATKVYSSGLWDGIFYDNVWDNASWMNGGNNDTNNDGVRDSATLIDGAWHDGMTSMLLETRRLLGPEPIIMGNGGQSYVPYMNGRLFEGFGFPWEGGWSGSVDRYRTFIFGSQKPATTTLNFNTDNTGNFTDYQKVRFGVGTSLLSDGYFAFDYGTNDHSQTVWYDEYDMDLGQPYGPAREALTGKIFEKTSPTVYRREFERGVVFVNGSDFRRKIMLGGELEAMRGVQDSVVNNGAVVTTVELPPKSAQMFRRPLDVVKDIAHVAGSFVRVLDATTGANKRNGFFTTYPLADAGADIVRLSGAGFGGTVAVIEKNGAIQLVGQNNTVVKTIRPFGGKYAKDLSFQVADIDGNGYQSLIVIGSGDWKNTPVEVYDFTGKMRQKIQLSVASPATPPSLAIVSANGKTGARIIVSSADVAPTVISIFDSKGKRLKTIQPYGKSLQPVSLGAVSRIPGTQEGGIAAALTHSTGSVSVRYYGLDGQLRLEVRTNDRALSDVRLGCTDVDGDGVAELLIFSTGISAL